MLKLRRGVVVDTDPLTVQIDGERRPAWADSAMVGGLPYTVFRDAILTHPTMAEGLTALFAAIPAPR